MRLATTLLTVRVERDSLALAATASAAPEEVLDAACPRLPSPRSLLAPHPQALDEVEQVLAAS